MPGIDRRLLQNFEWPIFVMGVAVAAIGIVNLISASPERGAAFLPDTAWRQLVWLGLGLVLLFATLVLDYRTLERVAIPFYGGVLLLLVAVLFVGRIVNGSQRWIDLGPMNLQPSELAKLALDRAVRAPARAAQLRPRRSACSIWSARPCSSLCRPCSS